MKKNTLLYNISTIISVIFLGYLFLLHPQRVFAAAPDVTGRVVSYYTGAPVVGIWVKWTDGVGGYRYAQTDGNGYYWFESISNIYDSGRLWNFIGVTIDTNLDGNNDDELLHEVDPVNAPVWDFSCASDPHTITGVVAAGMPGTFSTIGPISINNAEVGITLNYEDIIFTPDVPPTPTPVPVYSASGSVFVDTNANGVKDNGEANYSGTPVVTASRGVVTTSPGGLYTVSDVTAGSVTISVSVPSGFSVTQPRNGPPPSYQVILGPSCNTNGAPGASCN